MSSLQRYALEVRDATQAPRLPPLAVDMPFVLQGEDWVVTTLISERREVTAYSAKAETPR